MKKCGILLTSLLFVLSACGSSTLPVINIDDYVVKNEGNLGDFDLTGPANHMIVDKVDSFSWEASENAEKYMLEICSDEGFYQGIDTIDYYVSDNIQSTSFTIYADFAFKETTYYWRVTAKNSKSSKQSTSTFSFFVRSSEIEEFKLDLGEADDWKLHTAGSYATIGMDNSNFFNNGEKSLSITFNIEDTNQGIPESDGWIVVTKTIEKSIYGTDALYFNMYYAGQDANVIIRVVDRDNEYWYCPVQVSNNAKQSVILKFSDFIQRTKDVTVANEVFDYERIKYFEVVFEKSFGDGAFLLSDVRAIKFDNYKDLFIEKLNFSIFGEKDYSFENYKFEIQSTTDSLTLLHYGAVTGKEKINGYGFAKLGVERYFTSGSAIKVSIKYEGSKGTDVILRILEEDSDRWMFKVPYSALSSTEYKDLVIPYEAFAKHQIDGDGARQFYYIKNIQFGLQGQYGTGKLIFKDFEIVKKENYQTETTRVVAEDGLIEDFSSYQFNSDMYLIWTQSENNKDEYMDLNKSTKVVGNNNYVCGQFQYKSDMEAAKYYLPVKTETEYSSISMWLFDQSVKHGSDSASGVKNWSPDLTIYIRLSTKEVYTYTIKSLERQWNDYSIPFTSFTISNQEELGANVTPNPISSLNIIHIGISMQFYYKNSEGAAMPLYASDNPVLVDNISFNHRTTEKTTPIEKIIAMNGNIGMIDDFEDYETARDALTYWGNGGDADYQKIDISEDVSSKGGTHSLALQYKEKAASPSYYISPHMDSKITSKVLIIHMKSDVAATVYLNLTVNVSGVERKYRAPIEAINTEWTQYVVSLSNFIIEGGTSGMSSSSLKNVTRFSIGVVYNDGEEALHNLLIDNIHFDKSYTSYIIDPSVARTIID